VGKQFARSFVRPAHPSASFIASCLDESSHGPIAKPFFSGLLMYLRQRASLCVSPIRLTVDVFGLGLTGAEST
ncbi:hypothetical protein, partial [Novosphingobium olei]|uniref:hypothetical protein n=1 Tax=Novosphingobium olei TaxID=2728851 RepID=UPI0019825861